MRRTSRRKKRAIVISRERGNNLNGCAPARARARAPGRSRHCRYRRHHRRVSLRLLADHNSAMPGCNRHYLQFSNEIIKFPMLLRSTNRLCVSLKVDFPRARLIDLPTTVAPTTKYCVNHNENQGETCLSGAFFRLVLLSPLLFFFSRGRFRRGPHTSKIESRNLRYPGA